LAASQNGVLTGAQANGCGLGRHSQQWLVATGNWLRLAPGLLLTNNATPDWMTLAWAGVLQAGEGSRLGGVSAAYKHGLVDEPPSVIDILHPHGARWRNTQWWRFHQERPGTRQPQTVGGPPRTTIDDTVLDLAGTYLGSYDRHDALHWLTTAVQRRLTTADRLLAALELRKRIAGRDDLVDLLTDVGQGVQSPLEYYYARDVERAHGLPVGHRQARATSRDGSQWRDVRYDEFRLLVELDGQAGHVGSDRFRDYRRDNDALMSGDATLRYGWRDVRLRMCACALQVAGLLASGGWTPTPTCCPRCPPGQFDLWPKIFG